MNDKLAEKYTPPSHAGFTENDLELKGSSEVAAACQQAFEQGDYRAVLRCWNAMKKFDTAPAVSLAHVVESMQRFKKDTLFNVRELKAFFKKYPKDCEVAAANSILESLSKRLDSELME